MLWLALGAPFALAEAPRVDGGDIVLRAPIAGFAVGDFAPREQGFRALHRQLPVAGVALVAGAGIDDGPCAHLPEIIQFTCRFPRGKPTAPRGPRCW